MRPSRLAPAVAVLILATAAPAPAAPRPGAVDASFRPPLRTPPGNVFEARGVVEQPGGRIVTLGSAHADAWRDGITRLWGVTPAGAIDPSFGDSGEVTLPAGPGARPGICGQRLAVQPDGGLVLAGPVLVSPDAPKQGSVCRLTPDGRLDPAFGNGGVVALPYGVSDLLVDRGGRVIAVSVADGSIAVLRLAPDGSPDPAFGSAGRVSIAPAAGEGPAGGAAAATQPDGRLVVVARGMHRMLAMRLHADGTLDRSFAGGGELAPVSPENGWGPLEVLVRADGRLRVVGHGPGASLSVVGLRADGSADGSWGRNGLAMRSVALPGARSEYPLSAALDKHSGVVIGGAGSAHDPYQEVLGWVARLNPRGALDGSFGRGGVVDRDASALEPNALAIDRHGDILVAESHVNRYFVSNGPYLLRLFGGYDDARPRIAARARCRRLVVRIRDLSGMARVGVRARGRRVASSRLKRFTAQLPRRARRVVITAVDLAGNRTRRVLPVRRCR